MPGWPILWQQNDKFAAGESDPSEYVKVLTSKDTKTIDAFSSHVIQVGPT